MKNVFKFHLLHTLPIPGDHLNQITIDFLGDCDIHEDEDGKFAANTRVWFCLNRNINTPISAWQRIPLRPAHRDSVWNRDFFAALRVVEVEEGTIGPNDLGILSRLAI